jgi:cytochrome P450
MTVPVPAQRAEIDARVFNPYSKDFIRNPDPVWQKLIAEYPVAWHKDLQMWIVSSHELCDRMLKDNRFTPNFRAWSTRRRRRRKRRRTISTSRSRRASSRYPPRITCDCAS